MYYLRYLNHFLIAITTLVAILTYKKYRFTPNRYFLYLLLLTLTTEFIAYIPVYCYFHKETSISLFLKEFVPENLLARNYWVYNLFRILTFYIYLLYFFNYFKQRKDKVIICGLLLIYSIGIGIEFIIDSNSLFEGNQMIIRIFGSFGILIGAILYFGEVFNSDKVLKIYKDLAFWLIIGSVFYYLLTIPIMMFGKFFQRFQEVYVTILFLSNIILYGSFIIGFIINAKTNTDRNK